LYNRKKENENNYIYFPIHDFSILITKKQLKKIKKFEKLIYSRNLSFIRNMKMSVQIKKSLKILNGRKIHKNHLIYLQTLNFCKFWSEKFDRKVNLTESSFDGKCHLTIKNSI
jgi:hypothetical protein